MGIKAARWLGVSVGLCGVALVSLAFSCAAIAQERPAAAQNANQNANKDQQPAEHETPIPPEKTSTTHHELSLGGKSIKYTATAGTLLIRDQDDKPYGSIFYVAYTLDGADAKSRPVSFLYNGGPGSASLWLHMGSFGPKRIVTDSPKPTAGPPFELVDNQDSLLNKTDLVFIDAPMTGYSRAVGKSTAKDFAGVDEDLHAFDRFITRYLSVNSRWNSPKFLIGESYGTTRSAALADMLGNDGIQLNGVVLISSILNYNIRAAGYDMIYVANLPSYAAAAWYFNKIPNKPANISDWVQQAREFAAGPYAQALFAGHDLSDAETDSIAKQVSHFTGLSEAYVKETNLRVNPSRFRKEVLRDERMTLGRYDMRFEGEDVDAAGENPAYDPSDAGISGAFVAAFHDWVEGELKYQTTDTYHPSADSIGQWDWKHKPTSGGGEQSQPYVAGDLASAIRKNPHLKVFSANGWFDLATPFFATEYDLDHMQLPAELRGNVQFGYYPSGHMIYLNVEALHKLRGDLESFITGAEK